MRWQPDRRAPVAALLVLAMFQAVACGGEAAEPGGADGGNAPPSTLAAPGPAEADPTLEWISGQLTEDGELPVDAAKGIFAAEVGPIPGVDPLSPPEGGDRGHLAGMAVRRLRAASADLTPGEVEAIDAALDALADGEDLEVPVRGRSGGVLLRRSVEEARELVAAARDRIEDLSGTTLTMPIRVRLSERLRDEGIAERIGGTCRITFRAAAFDEDGASLRSTVAHEVWHCFQFQARPDLHRPAWVVEGQAEWVGETVAGGSPSSAGRWNTWLLAIDRSLYRRSYDAIGAYAVAEQAGAEVWASLLPMLGKGNDAALAELFDTDATDAARRIATALVREPAIGGDWESTGPGITGAIGSVPATVSEEPTTIELNVGALAALAVRLTVPGGDVLTVDATGGSVGAVGFAGGPTAALPVGGGVRYCLKPGGCTCEDGSTPGGGDGLPEAEPGTVGATVGATAAGTIVITAALRTLDSLCEEAEVAPITGQWRTDVSQVMATLAPGAPDCRGPYTLSFEEGGRFTAAYRATCSFGPQRADGVADLQGDYTADGINLAISNVTGDGRMTVGGVAMPLPLAEQLRAGLTVPATYVIEGDELAITFTGPSVGTVTLRYTRVG